MTDQDIKELTYAFLGGLVMFAIVFWYASSGQIKHHRFIKDCSTYHSKDVCEDIWSEANDE